MTAIAQNATSHTPNKAARLPISNEGLAGTARCFSADSFAKMQSIMYRKPIEKGSVLFWEGDPADKLIFVRSGRIRITKTSDTGRNMTLYMLQKGDLYGQPEPFANPVHAFSAEVLEDGEIGVMQMADLEVLLWQHGDLAIEFMKWMGLVHRMTQSKFRDLMLYGKSGALCSLLIRLCNSNGVQEKEGIYITLKISHAEMADMIGATRECVNRMLSDLRKEGVLTVREGHLLIKDVPYLRGVCRCDQCPMEICRL
ncbi:Crp/Fnr family transcriptional regulator [Cohnella thailandensis]|uniref:Crp/Fnr family transcriptional regulator n=1 Tax=Cohnella thailandensis TaxID=557557 RepID=A0A841T5L4_9BACL|nr:Crp/Fnr family transcriptional regulator [Cohnella thailandensis]MBB6637975.1 Crp/Fnr family transcriptional regulator [Cohnella thailandensis]MBP1976886.1 CRP/FNR family transcriptional regulator [Cohnella thailandensis]